MNHRRIAISTISIVIVFVLFLTIVDTKADITPVTYLSYVDNAYGFYRVIDITTHKPSLFNNRTLIINQGDTVTWINDADSVVLTVVSEQKLFGDKRLDIRQRASYTFDQIGTYNFYIKEYLGRHQTIIVSAIDTMTAVNTTDMTTTVDTGIYPILTPDYSENIPIPIKNTPVPTKNIPTPAMTISPSSHTDSLSITQIMSIIVAILSIFITYKVGKDSEGHKAEKDIEYHKEMHKKIEKEKKYNIKNEEKPSLSIKYGQRISGASCYLLGFLTGILFIVASRKENKFVRFHAIQSTITSLSLLTILLILAGIPSIGDIFGPLLIMIGPIIWILLMIKACQGKIYKLPIIGNIAERYC